jgi:hypothetical protein
MEILHKAKIWSTVGLEPPTYRSEVDFPTYSATLTCPIIKSRSNHMGNTKECQNWKNDKNHFW